MKHPEERRLLRTEEAAKYLGVSRQTLAKWRCLTSDGPVFLKIGRRVLYDLNDLDAWLSARKRRSTSDVGI